MFKSLSSFPNSLYNGGMLDLKISFRHKSGLNFHAEALSFLKNLALLNCFKKYACQIKKQN
jgi:hypothetical protein